LHVTTRSSGNGTSGVSHDEGRIVLFAEAFTTWGWLGGTIEHEYSHQGDEFDNSNLGLAASELQAWTQELSHVDKFGYSPAEIKKTQEAVQFWQRQYDYESGGRDW